MVTEMTTPILIALIINLIYAKAIGLTEGIAAREVGNDFWMATLMSILQGAVMMVITVLLIKQNAKEDLVQRAKSIVGPILGGLIGLLFVLYFAGAYAVVMITFVDHLRDYFLPELPTIVFVIVASLVALYAMQKGIVVTGRIAVVGVFSIILLNILLMIGTIEDFNIERLFPVFRTGIMATFLASRHADTDFAMASMMTGMILPYIAQKGKWIKATLTGVFYGGVLVMLWPILECGVLTAPETGHYIVACMQMARSAEIGWFVHRYEMIMVAFFAISLLVQLMMLLYCGVEAIAHTFTQKSSRLWLPITVLFSMTSYLIVIDHRRTMQFLSVLWPPFSLAIAFIVIALLLVIGYVQKFIKQRQRFASMKKS